MGRHRLPSRLVAAVGAVVLVGCTTTPSDQTETTPEPTSEPATEQADAQSEESTTEPDQASDTDEAGDSAIGEVLAYYPRVARMSKGERRKAAARLRARMASYECSDKRLKVLMLASHQPDLISEPEAFTAPCVDHADSDRTNHARLAQILHDRFKGALERRDLVERNETLRRQRDAARRRSDRLAEQLRGLKEIERSLQ
jgi:hypothetical protein